MASAEERDLSEDATTTATRILWRSPASVSLHTRVDAAAFPLGQRIQLRKHQRKLNHGTCLRPTHELLSASLERRTAITQSADLACALSVLDVRPGCTVIDAGTGAGSAVSAFARSVGPDGCVISCEYHEQRATTAAAQLPRLLGSHVHIFHQDVHSEGFPISYGSADCAFIDLPSPESVVPHVYNALCEGGTVGFLTPCIEQAQAVSSSLRSYSFAWVRSEERILRELAVSEARDNDAESLGAFGIPQSNMHGEKSNANPPCKPQLQTRTRPAGYGRGHTAYLTFARKPVDS